MTRQGATDRPAQAMIPGGGRRRRIDPWFEAPIAEEFVDVSEPPQIVFEQPASCGASAARAETAFKRALEPAKAPGAAWTVTMRVTREKAGLRATGQITDATGAPVGHRTIDGRECVGLADAIGVWASLVLDAEAQRAKDLPPPPMPPPTPPAPEIAAEPLPPEKPSPEAALFLAHAANERQIEIGLASYLMSGTGTGMMAGGTLFEVSEVGGGWFLRPAIALGRTFAEIVPTTRALATVGAARFDACKRLPGNYLEQRGIQLDLCAGPEIGFLYVDAQQAMPSELVSNGTVLSTTAATPSTPSRTMPLLAIGPSVDLRGELGNELSVLVRGVAEWNMLRASSSDGAVVPAVLIGRAEVGLSWRLR